MFLKSNHFQIQIVAGSKCYCHHTTHNSPSNPTNTKDKNNYNKQGDKKMGDDKNANQNYTYEPSQSTLHDVKNDVEETMNDMKNKGKEAWNDVKNKGKDTWNDMKNKGQDTWSDMKNKGQDAWSDVKNKNQDSWNDMQNKGQDAWTDVKNKGQDNLSDVKNKSKDAWTDIKNKGQDTWNDMKNKGKDTWNDLKNKAQDNLNEMKVGDQGVASGWKNTNQNEYDAAKSAGTHDQTTQPITDTLKNASQATLESAKQTISEYQSNLKSLFQMQNLSKQARQLLQEFTSAKSDYAQQIPPKLLKEAKGLIFLTMVKGGVGISGVAGSGIMIVRLNNNQWSAPCAVALGGIQMGFNFGFEKTNSIVILREDALKSFSSSGQLNIGAGASYTIGNIGYDANISMSLSDKGYASVSTYSMAKGAFVSLSLEGTMLKLLNNYNEEAYGKPITIQDLLENKVTSKSEMLNNEDYKATINLISEYSDMPDTSFDEFSKRFDDNADKRNATSSKDQNLDQTLSKKQNQSDIYSNLDHKSDEYQSGKSSTANSYSNLRGQPDSNKTNESEEQDKKDDQKDKHSDRAHHNF